MTGVPSISRTVCISIKAFIRSDLGTKEIQSRKIESVAFCDTKRQKILVENVKVTAVLLFIA